MHDDWFGHRDWLSGEPEGDKDEWIEWDHLLADSYQTIEDHTDQHGLLVWEREDERVEIDAEKRIHKFEAARDRATSGSKNKPYKAAPGEYFVPKMFSRDRDKKIQTYREWIDKMAAEEAEKKPN